MVDGKYLSHSIPIKPRHERRVRWVVGGTCNECGSYVELYRLEDGTLGRQGCQCCSSMCIVEGCPIPIEDYFMLEPDITPDDFNELTSSTEHDNWLNGVEIGHDGEFISIDTPYAMGFEEVL